MILSNNMAESLGKINEQTSQENDSFTRTFKMAFYQAIAVQQDDPRWLCPENTVFVDGEELTYEFVGVNQKGEAVNRRPNPEQSLLDKLLGKNKYIEKLAPLDMVADAELVLSFYAMYSSDKGAIFFDPNNI